MLIKNLKNKLLFFTIFILFLFLLTHPQQALITSRNSLQMWLNTLIPTLLPFLILTDLLIQTDQIEKLFSPFRRLFHFIFGLSAAGTYCLIIGLLCGYPMGAKTAVNLYESKKISKAEAHYLITFCNNASPAFLISYLHSQCFKRMLPLWKILFPLITANFLCMLFFRFFVYKDALPHPFLFTYKLQKKTPTRCYLKIAIDASFMNSFEVIALVGGYILLFSLITTAIRTCWPSNSLLVNILCSSMELTSGLPMLANAGYSLYMRFVLSMILTASGGLCILMQTYSILKNKLSILPYIAGKCLNMMFTLLLIPLIF